MSNPFAGIITSEMKLLYTNMIDSLLETTALTLPCKFIYNSASLTICPNCVYDPLSGKSSSRYKTGGVISFPNGQLCPVCGGLGKISLDSTETIYLMVIYNAANWLKLHGNNITAQTPEAHALTLSKLTTYPNIKQANELIIDTSITDTTVNRHIRIGEPELLGFGASSYLLTKWNKISDGT